MFEEEQVFGIRSGAASTWRGPVELAGDSSTKVFVFLGFLNAETYGFIRFPGMRTLTSLFFLRKT